MVLVHEITSEPTIEPVTLEEAKQWRRVAGFTDHDEIISDLIKHARELAEQLLNRSLITQTVVAYAAAFDTTLTLPRAPVQSISSVKYYDSADVQQTLSTDVYQSDLKAEPCTITTKKSQTWPSVYDRYNPIEITFIAGYGAQPDTVPEAIKTLIKMLLSTYHDFDAGVVIGTIHKDLPLGVATLVGNWKVYHGDDD
jgi:uncharacterized phiE125 gp8 family phage protein